MIILVLLVRKESNTASYKTKLVNSISKPLHMLHMDMFGPTNVKSLMKKSYYLVVTDDFSRFSLVFFSATKDETSGILKTFITEIENQLDHKVKFIRSDNGTEFKNSIMNQFCEIKGIKREFSVARTPQQNGIAERKNRTLIEVARTMLIDSKLPTTFWAEAVNTTCYVLNRVLVIKPHNKTPYELIHGRPPLIDFKKPFGCPVTILNTRDHLGKFKGKADKGYFVGYYVVSKAMKRIFRYIKGQPTLGLWYPRDLPFDLEAFSDSDYAGASLDRKSTTREYVAAANCCGQNPVSHSKTKHIEIRYHFIRDSYEKKLIQVIKIHTDKNIADLLTKAFDVSREKGQKKSSLVIFVKFGVRIRDVIEAAEKWANLFERFGFRVLYMLYLGGCDTQKKI
ncbi:putative ribonuclease H-like domain-containing protein [Tanacetum coccineum]|uniref:Ribonuclease H-like domain-containing protein n=1 Tax=Tanacetum coccineum TaxID=301880 RepID=A0ABQ5JAV5_9ASTR